MNAALRQLYFGDGQFYELSPDDDDFQFDFDDSLFDAAAREILDNGGYTPDYLTTPTGSALINETNRAFTDAISKGLGQSPDPAVAAALRENAFIFSGFKTHTELEQVAQLITDENGNIRPFNEFLNDVQKLNKDYNHTYLRTEYNQAVQSAQMASKWADFERDKAHINLQYRTANDERVRASHRVLHGVTLPVDDKFWEQYTPPNGWGCRCTVVAVPKDDADYPVKDVHGSTIDGKEVFPTPAYEIFKTNTAKDKKLFPDKHPYLPKGCGNCQYKSLVFNDVKAICKACRKVDAASARWSNDVTKTHYRNIIKENERQKWMVDNGPVKDITVTRSNIELLIWKPHKRYFAKNMAIYYLKQLMQDKKQVVFIGSSKDIKGDSRNGHTNETVWYYYKMKFLGGYSYIVVKEYNGERIVHMIQDEDHFDESKIKNKA